MVKFPDDGFKIKAGGCTLPAILFVATFGGMLVAMLSRVLA